MILVRPELVGDYEIAIRQRIVLANFIAVDLEPSVVWDYCETEDVHLWGALTPEKLRQMTQCHIAAKDEAGGLLNEPPVPNVSCDAVNSVEVLRQNAMLEIRDPPQPADRVVRAEGFLNREDQVHRVFASNLR